MKHLKLAVVGVALILGTLFGGLATAPVAMATTDNALTEACKVAPDSPACNGETSDSGRLPTIASNIINTALYIVGILAVAMIVFSGLRYVMSAGDKKRIEQSKQILIYSIVGLIVAIIAYAIVNYVVSLF